VITGEKSGDQFGYSLGGGDLDDDGAPDLIIGSRSHSLSDRADANFNDAGAAYVFYGQGPGGLTVKMYLPLVFKGP
jgi:hypothetical protein